jgi:hypothetical protein
MATKSKTQQATEEPKAPEENAGATAPAPETTPAPEASPEQNEQPGPEAAPPAPAPEEEAPELKLYTLEEMAEANRVPGWQSAALHRLMGWEPGKRVRAAEYKAGLARLKNRRIGG